MKRLTKRFTVGTRQVLEGVHVFVPLGEQPFLRETATTTTKRGESTTGTERDRERQREPRERVYLCVSG